MDILKIQCNFPTTQSPSEGKAFGEVDVQALQYLAFSRFYSMLFVHFAHLADWIPLQPSPLRQKIFDNYRLFY